MTCNIYGKMSDWTKGWSSFVFFELKGHFCVFRSQKVLVKSVKPDVS